jgi:DNA-binding NarL/FixJ family response regulator
MKEVSRNRASDRDINSDAIRTAIIEDDPTMMRWFEDAMADAGDIHIMASARTALEGEALIDAGGFDVLLCDLGLPDGDGIDLIRRAAGHNPDVDIIVVTIFAQQRKVVNCIRAGARGYLLKDLEPETCVDAIREIRRGGSPISPVIARHLLTFIQPNAPALHTPLSDREMDVLNMIARGFSNNECGGLLNLSVHTVNTHVKSIYRKLDVSSRAEAVYEATYLGIIEGD